MSGRSLFTGGKVGILAGGPSSEREISLKSGQAVKRAFEAAGIDSVLIDAAERDLLDVIRKENVDVAFIALHGKFGEDGAVQELLSGAGIPYTDSGPEASRTALDKLASKEMFRKAGLLVPEFRSVAYGQDTDNALRDAKVPCVVKPRYEGSSIGLTVVRHREELAQAVEKGLKFGGEVLVEEYIPGRELTVGVLEEKALPVVEITVSGGVYDYDSKYRSQSTVYKVPAEIGKDNFERAQEAGIAAHKALGCRGFSRTDIRMTSDGRLYVLEVNTIPGLTEKSLLPMAAKAAGFDFELLCVKMLESASNGRVKR
ncbi:MAG TPA: D-alanine--D-alanine ligase [Candidatus Omnitrophota bacterium]|nr:D-alanine--D-alanine ligase [Candidatus Omnitrophota bacterium]